MSKIEKAVELDMRNKGRFVELVSTAGSRKALLIAQVLAVVQRLSGISVIMAYASAAIPQAGSLTPNSCAILLCVDWILFGFFATVLVGYVRIRPHLGLYRVFIRPSSAAIDGTTINAHRPDSLFTNNLLTLWPLET